MRLLQLLLAACGCCCGPGCIQCSVWCIASHHRLLLTFPVLAVRCLCRCCCREEAIRQKIEERRRLEREKKKFAMRLEGSLTVERPPKVGDHARCSAALLFPSHEAVPACCMVRLRRSTGP